MYLPVSAQKAAKSIVRQSRTRLPLNTSSLSRMTLPCWICCVIVVQWNVWVWKQQWIMFKQVFLRRNDSFSGHSKMQMWQTFRKVTMPSRGRKDCCYSSISAVRLLLFLKLVHHKQQQRCLDWSVIFFFGLLSNVTPYLEVRIKVSIRPTGFL